MQRPFAAQRGFALALAAALSLVSGCRCGSQAPAPAMASADAGEDEVRPVYPRDDRPPEPLAASLCSALHGLPEQQRSACCHRPPGVTFAEECSRALSVALRSGALTLDAARVQACAAALARTHAGCDWIGPLPPAPPAECRTLFSGTRGAGARCRSALECQAGLRCRGAGPTQAGTCAEPGAARAACGLASDVLATYSVQDQEAEHPECAGVCERHLCTDPVPAGGACTRGAQCGRGRHCAGGRCADGPFAAEGAPCVADGCGPGLVCEKTCARLKPAGASCTTDFECLGGCVKPGPAATEGVCGMRCDVR